MARSEEKEKNLNRLVPKLWYGWFGRGNQITGICKLITCKRLYKKNY